MARKRLFDPEKDEPMPYPELTWKELKQPGNEKKCLERNAWANRLSYSRNSVKLSAQKASKRNMEKKQKQAPSQKAAKPSPTPTVFKDDSSEFNSLLAITPINEPFVEAKKTERPGVHKPKASIDDAPDDAYDEFDEGPEETAEEPASPGGEHEYVEMDDAKAYLFVRLSNFAAAVMTKMLYWCIGFDTDMEAMKLSDKDVAAMAEDAKWFIKDVGMTPQQMFAFSLCGTVVMNGFYAATKQKDPWWKKYGNNAGNSTEEKKGPFRAWPTDEFTDAVEV
jgi:hypothetical protein